MSLVRKLQSGGESIRINDIDYDKQILQANIKNSANLYKVNSNMTPELASLFQNEVDNFYTNGTIGTSPEFQLYMSMILQYGGASLVHVPKQKKKFNGNDYLLENYAIKDYNSDLKLFSTAWERSDEKYHRSEFVKYLRQAAKATDYDYYDQSKNQYKSLEDLNKAFADLAAAIENSDENQPISDDIIRLGLKLGIDIPTWMNPEAKPKEQTSTADDYKNLYILTKKLEYILMGISEDEALRRAEDDYLKYTTLQRKTLDDNEFINYCNDIESSDEVQHFISEFNNNFNRYSPNEGALLEYTKRDNSLPEAQRRSQLNYRMSELRKHLQNVNGANILTIWNLALYLSLFHREKCFIVDNTYWNGKKNPYLVTVYDGNTRLFRIYSIYNSAVLNLEYILRYQLQARANWKSKYKIGGKILKAQQGLELYPNDEVYQNYINYLNNYNLSLIEILEEQPEGENTDWQFDGSDYAHMIAGAPVVAGRSRRGYKKGGQIKKYQNTPGPLFKIKPWKLGDTEFQFEEQNPLKLEIPEKYNEIIETFKREYGKYSSDPITRYEAEHPEAKYKKYYNDLLHKSYSIKSDLDQEYNNWLKSLLNPEVTDDPFRRLLEAVNLNKELNARDTSKKIADLAKLQIGAFSTTANYTGTRANIYGLERDKLSAMSQYNVGNPITSNASDYYVNATLSAINKAKTALQYDTQKSKNIDKIAETNNAILNQRAYQAALNADKNSQAVAALHATRLLADMLDIHNLYNITQNIAQEKSDQLTRDRYEYYDKLAKARLAESNYINNDYALRKLGEINAAKYSRIVNLLNTKNPSTNENYTMDEAERLANAEFAGYETILNQRSDYLKNISAIGNMNVGVGQMPRFNPYPWKSGWNSTGKYLITDAMRHGITGPVTRKSGGLLTYEEKKALLQDKLKNKQIYDDWKQTAIRNAKARLDAEKMFKDASNAATLQIYKLINKAIGK